MAAAAGLAPVIGAGSVVWWVSGLPDKDSVDAATVGAFYLALLALLGSVLRRVWGHLRAATVVFTASLVDFDHLAQAVRGEWEPEALRRKLRAPAPIPVRWSMAPPALRGSIAGAVGLPGQSRAFRALPGLCNVTEEMLSAGGGQDQLHSVYGGLASGRLVITGAPGAGKTGAGILLLLEALRYRERLPDAARTLVPVPVMFTLAGWNPERTSFQTWLGQKVASTYSAPGHQGHRRAASLVASGGVAAFVDGLDEVPAALRPVALEAMSASGVRIVLLTRIQEMDRTTDDHLLVDAAVVRLRYLGAETVADYLERSLPGPPPAHWNEFLGRLRSDPAGRLARSLRTPLMLTLIRDTYDRGGDIRALLEASDSCSAKSIEDHLLDRVVEAAYATRVGEPPPRYSLDTARSALSFIAKRMALDGTHDLAWWLLPRWAPRRPRVQASFVTVGLAGGLLFGLIGGWSAGLAIAFPSALVSGASAASDVSTYEHRHFAWRSIRSWTTWMWALGTGVAAGVAAGLAAGQTAGVLFGLAAGLAVALVRTTNDSTTPLTPSIAWRDGCSHALAVGLLTGLFLGLTIGLLVGQRVGYAAGLAGGPVGGLVVGLAAGFAVGFTWSAVWSTQLTFVQLAIAHDLPVRLLRFLRDAHEREVLRAVGPVYQFRHARLQDRLAALSIVNDS